METFKSDLTGTVFPMADRVPGKLVRKSVMEFIHQDYPQFNESGFLSVSELNLYREKYFTEFLQHEVGELTDLENKVISSLMQESTLTDKLDGDEDQKLTTGQKVADKVATFGGSWRFIILFGLFLFIWICINIFWFMNQGFDPYPFILLNLILSCLAAIQAPVIMMSQNRQEEKDRERAKKDYMINLKAEVEIRVLHEKLDLLIMHQKQELIEIQQAQIDLMNDILRKMKEEKD
jgi:uncharacterized membrane protein